MSEKSLGEKMAAVEAYKASLNSLVQQEQYIRQALDNYLMARETLRNYSEAKDGSEILVPVGGNSYVFAQVLDKTRVLRGVGNDIVVEDDFEGAMKGLTGYIEEMGSTLQTISSKIVDLERKLQHLSAEVEQEYSAMGAEGQMQG